MDSESSEVVASDFALTCVQTSSEFDAEPARAFDDGLCAANGPSRTVEGSHKPVSRRIDLSSTKAAQFVAHGPIVGSIISGIGIAAAETGIRLIRVEPCGHRIELGRFLR